MPSVGHIAVGLAAGRAYVGRGRPAGKAMLAFSILSVLPDADVVGFRFGVEYGDPWGHRGATHSLAMALFLGAACWALSYPLKLPHWKTFLVATAVAVSHGLMDTLTRGGGLGCELLWPFSTERFWSPLRFIPIAPIGLGMLSAGGLLVVAVELIVFSPFWLYATWPRRPRPAP